MANLTAPLATPLGLDSVNGAQTIRHPNIGLVFSLTGTAISSSYQAGSWFKLGGAKYLMIKAYIYGAESTLLTTATLKLQGAYDSTVDACDLVSENNSNGTVELAHNYTPVASDVIYKTFTVDPSCFIGGIRVLAKATGTSKSGDQILAYAAAW